MTLRLHNTLTRSDELFTPQNPDKVTLYTCGPTVYSYLHVGNWAAYIYWDILVRTLTANDYKVERVMNITDVGHLVSDEDDGEDKMQKGARREGKTAWEVAKFYSEDFIAGMKHLNLIEPAHLTRATNYIEEQLALVRSLKDKGYTYQIDDGIYFDTSKFPTYADFARLDLAAQQAGARVAFNREKRNASDFALWKFSPKNEQRDMEWGTPPDLITDGESKKGFPGWHLECSAMAMNILGDTLDIHTGGIDHIPVHHTNEIAQSESLSGVRFSNYWLHNNHLKVNGAKISKSLGNGYTLSDLEEKGYSPLDYRMFALQSHYRSEGNFTFENLTAAKQRLRRWKEVAAIRHQIHDTLTSHMEREFAPYAAKQAVLEALNNDLGTPQALTIIDEVFDSLPVQNIDHVNRDALVELLMGIDSLLGLDLIEATPDIDDTAKQLILTRERARDEKDWARSDELRTELQQTYGVTVRDTPHGTVWSYL
jgi:cysteinyl-tRNA synthetase